MAIRVAIIGYGKIARDQHRPAIAADSRFELVAVVDPGHGAEPGLPCFASAAEMFAEMQGRVDAVAICTPPQVRHSAACAALDAGISVLLEKPPAATLGELDDLVRRARGAGVGLYAAWHSQHAPAVSEAGRLLAGATIAKLDIAWFEDVRKWHPGQEWIWSAGGFGVFDPGINALSIATRILPAPLLVRSAQLTVPTNRQAPIAADLEFEGAAARARFDWRHTDGERWTIAIETSDGRTIVLEDGGARLLVDGSERPVRDLGEYALIYREFARVVDARTVEADREPLRIVADAFLVGQRNEIEPFV